MARRRPSAVTEPEALDLVHNGAEWADLTEQRVDAWPEVEPDDAMRAAAIDLVHSIHQRATEVAARHVDPQANFEVVRDGLRSIR